MEGEITEDGESHGRHRCQALTSHARWCHQTKVVTPVPGADVIHQAVAPYARRWHRTPGGDTVRQVMTPVPGSEVIQQTVTPYARR